MSRDFTWVYRIDFVKVSELKFSEDIQDMNKVYKFVTILIDNPDYEFPPVLAGQSIFEDDLLIRDGHHRTLAYSLAGREFIQCEMLIKDYC